MVMTPNPVPSIPSREAVEAEARELDELVRLMPQATSDSGSLAARMLRDLRAEVERLTTECKDIAGIAVHKDDIIYDLRDRLERTVTEQAAALEKIHSWLVCAPIATVEDMAQSFDEMEQVARAALASQTRD